MICIDAGIVIRRVIFPDQVAVQEIWDSWVSSDAHLVSPSLLYYEITNGLYRYQKQGWLSKETVDVALAAALSLPIEIIEDAALHRQAKTTAEQYNLPAAYDAHYLALALRLGIDMWTADQRLFNTLQAFHLGWLRLIDQEL